MFHKFHVVLATIYQLFYIHIYMYVRMYVCMYVYQLIVLVLKCLIDSSCLRTA